MPVYLPADSKYYRYDVQFNGRRYSKSTGLTKKRAAQQFEDAFVDKLRRRAAGIEDAAPGDTPTFTEWAEVTLAWQRDEKQVKRPDEIAKTLRMILAFWGARPTTQPAVEGGPYLNLRLGDPSADPDLLVEFDEWMRSRKLSGARINHYRSACSMMYRVAMLPKHRKLTGIRVNPFRDLGREKTRRRTATIAGDDLARLIETAPLPVAVGVLIGALTPALRLANVVALKRDEHVSPDRRFLTVPHKTDRETGRPLVVAVPIVLQELLSLIYSQHPDDEYVVHLTTGPARPNRRRKAAQPQGPRYWKFMKLVRQAMLDAGLPYGRSGAGVTFHSLRHTTNTNLARWGVPRDQRRAAGGHSTTAMTDWYTHLSGTDTVDAAAAISREMGGLASLVAARLRQDAS